MERESRREQEFEVEIENVDTASGIYTLWIESSAGSGQLENAGEFEAEGPGEAKYEREIGDKHEEGGKKGSLPLGVSDLRELEDRDVEVRDPAGAAILIGTIPRFGRSNGGGGNHEHENERERLRPVYALD